mgnify:CR=1 FL=1
MLITVRLHKILHANGLDLHDITYVKVEDPLILIEEA